RYNDPILFLDVTSISAAYTWEATAGLLGNSIGKGTDSYGGALGGRLSESPFITYAPNTGKKFVQQMLTPMDLRTVALIVQAGWSIERVLLIMGESMNQLRNNPAASDPATGYPRYQQVAKSLRALQKNGDLSLGVGETRKKKDKPQLSLLIAADAARSEPYLSFCQSISVACDGSPLLLRQAIGTSSDGQTMALATRSLNSAMYFLSLGVEAPAEDVAAGVTSPNIASGPLVKSQTGERLFHVLSSAGEPERAAVKVHYRNSWFYIADNDADSKTTFALVSMLVMLQSGDTSKVTPLITLPAG
ncbi:MAG: hypothetical protein ACREO9_00500, partial [Lysobacterales bacterium]